MPADADLSCEQLGLITYHFNHHLQYHCKTCFKKGSEGRCNLPDQAECKTHILYSTRKYDVFAWNGELTPQHSITIRPKRFCQDAFTNTYCKLMSSCRAPCNSNVSVLTGARAAIYTSCYAAKGTQQEDTAEFKNMASYVANRFMQQRKENSMFEGLS
jgi:hypothetical protein